MIEQYRRWFNYERDAHRLTLDSLTHLDSPQEASPSFQKAVDLLAHLVAARNIWLSRMCATTEKVELFPKGVQVGALEEQLQQMETRWLDYLERLSDSDLERVFEYSSYDGGQFRNSVGDILTQLFGHSWYHRGQIAALVRSIGGKPAETDFVFWTREPANQGTG